MGLLSILLNTIEVIVLVLGAAVLGITIHFFMASRRSLQQVISPQRRMPSLAVVSPQQTIVPAQDKKPFEDKQRELKVLQEKLLKVRTKKQPEPEEQEEEAEEEFRPLAKAPQAVSKDDLIDSLKQTIAQQQKLLNGFLKQIDELQDDGKDELEARVEELELKISKLKKALGNKASEVESLEQQLATAHNMTSRIDEVVKEFESVQDRMMELEVSASKAEGLQLDLQQVTEDYQLLQQDLIRKQEKLEESLNENGVLRQRLHETEDKLAESNRLRSQLQKKIGFLQDLNNDLHQVTESNKKMQTELRRIGELESMLNMIAEERDQLLRKQR